jgi:hypothetical protein
MVAARERRSGTAGGGALLAALMFSGLVLAGLLAIGTVPVLAQPAQDEEDYPHAYPREGVTKRYENERVIVWEVIWPDGVPAEYHRHRYDMTGVFLRWGPLRVTRPDGTFTVSETPFEVPSTFLLRKGVTHKEEGIGQPERHSIMIDMKDYAPPPREPRTDVPPEMPHEGATLVLDEEPVRVWDVRLAEGQELPLHVHNSDTVAVILEGGTLRETDEDGIADTRIYAYRDVSSGPPAGVRTGTWSSRDAPCVPVRAAGLTAGSR